MQTRPDTMSLASQPDEVLLAAYKTTGDLEQLAALYKRYMGLVYAVCLKYLKSQPASEDAVMDIFEQLVEKAKVHEIEHFKPWLAVVARNHCLMQLRKKSPADVQGFEEEFMYSGDLMHPDGNGFQLEHTGQTEAEAKEFALTSMEKCLETLAEGQKISVELFYLQQKCYREVADITGYPVDKVRSYIQNGRRNLKICMEKQTSD